MLRRSFSYLVVLAGLLTAAACNAGSQYAPLVPRLISPMLAAFPR
jgi:hypothetical protein